MKSEVNKQQINLTIGQVRCLILFQHIDYDFYASFPGNMWKYLFVQHLFLNN